MKNGTTKTKRTARRLYKQDYICYAMAYEGLNGANRVQILRRAHELQHDGDTVDFVPTSNRCYFLDGTGNGSRQSLINNGLIRREKPGVFTLTQKGYALADIVQPIVSRKAHALASALPSIEDVRGLPNLKNSVELRDNKIAQRYGFPALPGNEVEKTLEERTQEVTEDVLDFVANPGSDEFEAATTREDLITKVSRLIQDVLKSGKKGLLF